MKGEKNIFITGTLLRPVLIITIKVEQHFSNNLITTSTEKTSSVKKKKKPDTGGAGKRIYIFLLIVYIASVLAEKFTFIYIL